MTPLLHNVQVKGSIFVLLENYAMTSTSVVLTENNWTCVKAMLSSYRLLLFTEKGIDSYSDSCITRDPNLSQSIQKNSCTYKLKLFQFLSYPCGKNVSIFVRNKCINLIVQCKFSCGNKITISNYFVFYRSA